MPRVHIQVQDLDSIESLEEMENWDELLGLNGEEPRRDNIGGDPRNRGRGERRFGGSESLARKRDERRKQYSRRRAS
jgi:hypothetical protein